MQSLRFLYVIARGDSFGGSSLHVMDMATELEGRGHRVRIVVGGNEEMEVPRRFAARSLDFVCLPELGRRLHPLLDLRATLAIRREVKSFSPDLVSLHASKAGALGRVSCLGLGLPVFYTPHCWSFVEGFPKARLYRLAEKFLAPFCDRIVAVSEDERVFGLASGVGSASRTITIHNGVRDRFPSLPISRPHSRPIRIVSVGRFEEQKNQKLLVEALAELQEFPWELTLVGDGPLRQECEDFARSLGIFDRIDFAGYSDEVEHYLGTHDVFALITNWEGFPRSILEAMSAGMPVVASDVGGIREAVFDGVNGRIAEPGDLPSTVAAFRDLFEDPDRIRFMGEASRERFLRHFSFEVMFGNYEELYHRRIRAFRARAGKPAAIAGPSSATEMLSEGRPAVPVSLPPR